MADFGTVGGGAGNIASNSYATVGGGDTNTASGYAATVGGGDTNTADSNQATIGGGSTNTASGDLATIGGGFLNRASGDSATVGGGSGNTASGASATIGGGSGNVASGDYSFAAGYHAQANHTGAFVWADSQNGSFASSASNQFCVRAAGGIVLETGQNAFLYTSSTSGEKNRYLSLFNSPQTTSASGLKAGGILCSDDYSFANPGKNDMVIKGTLGVGFFSPAPYVAAFKGNVYSSGNFVASDARYKKNVTPLGNALDSVLKLRGVSYNWNKVKYPDQNFTDDGQIGFIAQEIEKIFPELVMTAPDGYKAVNYVGVIPVLVEAVRTLKNENDATQKENAELKARLARLEAAVEKLQDAKNK